MAMKFLLIALMAAVQWLVVPDGPDTYAVVLDYGGEPHWAHPPNSMNGRIDPGELRICSQVPSREAAQEIADFMNGLR